MNNIKKVTLGLVGTLIALFLLGAGIFYYCYTHVSSGEKPVKSDVIIMIEGGDNGRYTEAGRFYQENYAPKVMISPAIEDPNGLNNVKAVEEAGVPAKDIIKEPGPTTSTWLNATNTLALMKKLNLKSAMVVTTDYHTTRTRLAYERANKKYNYDITVVGVRDNKGKTWNETKNGKNQAFREAWVTPAYWLGLYHFLDI